MDSGPMTASSINKMGLSALPHYLAVYYLQSLDSNRKYAALISRFLQLLSSQVHVPPRQQTIQFFSAVMVFFVAVSMNLSVVEVCSEEIRGNVFASPHLIF